MKDGLDLLPLTDINNVKTVISDSELYVIAKGYRLGSYNIFIQLIMKQIQQDCLFAGINEKEKGISLFLLLVLYLKDMNRL